jgi:predicted nucleic acid-binding protein
VKFWDTSALVPLLVDEETTTEVRQLFVRDPDVVIWLLTSVELLSAIGRLGRRAAGIDDLVPALRSEAVELVSRCVVVSEVDGVRRRAERLVGVHPIAAADAMQIGAALVACEDRPERLEIVTLDAQLARCAQLEGFRVIAPALA